MGVNPHAGRSFEASLPPDYHAAYILLAAMQPEVPVPLSVLQQLWRAASLEQAAEMVNMFELAGVARAMQLQDGKVWVMAASEHLTYLHATRTKQVPGIHQQWLDVYALSGQANSAIQPVQLSAMASMGSGAIQSRRTSMEAAKQGTPAGAVAPSAAPAGGADSGGADGGQNLHQRAGDRPGAGSAEAAAAEASSAAPGACEPHSGSSSEQAAAATAEAAAAPAGANADAASDACMAPVDPCQFVNDGYILLSLGHHLVGAARLSDMRQLLVNPAWLEEKLHAYGVAAVVADFRRWARARRWYGSGGSECALRAQSGSCGPVG